MQLSTSKTRFLTKSKFKTAVTCPTQLFYSDARNGYFNANDGNDFLAALADGGTQVGELAKFLYDDDPLGHDITIKTLDSVAALAETEQRISQLGRKVIAEAAIHHGPFLARVDILIHDADKRSIEVIEVKSKSVDEQTVQSNFRKADGTLRPDWAPYLYDLAFQAEIAREAFPGYAIHAKLLLLDKQHACAVDGLHQRFPVLFSVEGSRRIASVAVDPSLRRDDLGALDFLREVDLTDHVAVLRTEPVTTSASVPMEAATNLRTFMDWAAQIYQSNSRTFLGVSKTCRQCPFRAAPGEPLRSGIHECWKSAIDEGWIMTDTPALQGASALLEEVPRTAALSIDLWGGGAGAQSVAQKMLDASRAFLTDIEPGDLGPAQDIAAIGFTPYQRRLAQIASCQDPTQSFLLREDRLADMDEWEWPLHMIDFETSAPALPFFTGMKPYETLAFQFSHHRMDRLANGNVRITHANQWISTTPGAYPNVEFVRALRRALMPSGQLFGTVFRYHNHENSVLRAIHASIEETAAGQLSDQKDLLEFIDLITKTGGRTPHIGRKSMVDLHRLVQEGYYSAHAGGSISLKYMLPAILHDVPSLSDLYGKAGIYGKDLALDSLNFDGPEGHTWLTTEADLNPYRTLPSVFSGDAEPLNAFTGQLLGDSDDGMTIDQGGLAMTAYNYTQFNALDEIARKRIEMALLKYCELDTLAMVILVQGLLALRGKPMSVLI